MIDWLQGSAPGAFLSLGATVLLVALGGVALWSVCTAETDDRRQLRLIAGVVSLGLAWKVGQTSVAVLQTWYGPEVLEYDIFTGDIVGYGLPPLPVGTLEQIEFLNVATFLLALAFLLGGYAISTAVSLFVMLANIANYGAALTVYGTSHFLATRVTNGVLWLLCAGCCSVFVGLVVKRHGSKVWNGVVIALSIRRGDGLPYGPKWNRKTSEPPVAAEEDVPDQQDVIPESAFRRPQQGNNQQ